MRVATTRTGIKIHLLDQSQYADPPCFTACGRRESAIAFIKRPKPGEVCQVCANAMWVRIGRLRVDGAKVEVIKRKLSPENPAQQKIE